MLDKFRLAGMFTRISNHSIIPALLVALFLITLPASAPAVAALLPGQDAVVNKIVDGNTIEVKIGARTFIVRYIGVDMLETMEPNTPVQC